MARNKDVAAHKAAKQALSANQSKEIAGGVTEETDTYRALNSRVNETATKVSWFRR